MKTLKYFLIMLLFAFVLSGQTRYRVEKEVLKPAHEKWEVAEVKYIVMDGDTERLSFTETFDYDIPFSGAFAYEDEVITVNTFTLTANVYNNSGTLVNTFIIDEDEVEYERTVYVDEYNNGFVFAINSIKTPGTKVVSFNKQGSKVGEFIADLSSPTGLVVDDKGEFIAIGANKFSGEKIRQYTMFFDKLGTELFDADGAIKFGIFNDSQFCAVCQKLLYVIDLNSGKVNYTYDELTEDSYLSATKTSDGELLMQTGRFELIKGKWRVHKEKQVRYSPVKGEIIAD